MIKWIRWNLRGRPRVFITDQNCGCCGRLLITDFSIPSYQYDPYWSHWGICQRGTGCNK
jgi:hypothetical protein